MPTQIEIFNQELKKLGRDVTPKDVLAAIETLGYSRTSIYNYIWGEGKNNDRACELIKFLRQRIADRNKILQP